MQSLIRVNCLIFLFLCGTYLLGYSPSTEGLTSVPNTTKVVYGIDLETALTLDMINELSFDEIAEQRGKPLKIKEKVVLTIAKNRIKKALKKGVAPASILEDLGRGDFIFNWPVFLLSLFFGPLILIFALFGDRSTLISAGLGCLIWALWLGLLIYFGT